MDGSGSSFSDSATSPKVVTAAGNATQITPKFGSAAAYFDGDGDYLSLADSTDWDFGTGDFTIDFWLKTNGLSSGGYGGVTFGNNATTNEFLAPWLDNQSSGRVIIRNVDYVTGISFTPGSWQHVAVVRSGNNLTVYVNGTQSGTTGNVTGISIGKNTNNYVGGGAHESLNGYLDELRITKGLARWTSNFTPPARAGCR